MNARTTISLVAVAGFCLAFPVPGQTTGQGGGVSIKSGAASVTVNTNGNSGAIAVAIDPGGKVSGSISIQSDEILGQVEDAMRQSLDRLGDAGLAREALDQARKKMQMALSEARGGKSAARFGTGGRGTVGVFGQAGVLGSAARREPAVVTTSTMDPVLRGEWQEDLKVMDKLLRDEVSRVEGELPRHAMGIRLLLSEPDSPPPTFLEGYGVLFSLDSEIVLASTGHKAGKAEENKTSSAWENARREVNSFTNGNVHVWVQSSQSGFSNSRKPRQEFDAARLRELEDAMIGILGEARNIRHLQKGENVTVTIVGSDDAGDPQRLTLKARKEDIEQFGAGKIGLEEFKKRVARSVG